MKKANFLLKNCKNYEDLCKWAAGSFLPEPRPFEFTGQTAPGEPSFRQAPEPMPPIELQEWMNENRPAVQEPIVSPGGLFPEVAKEIAIKKVMEHNPTFPLRKAIERMMNNTPLRQILMRRLYIYSGNQHPHHGQQPVQVTLC